MISENQMRKKRPGMLQTAILYHDKAALHSAAQTAEIIKTLGFELLDKPSYSPDLAPCDFFSISIDQECFERYAI